MVRHYTNDKISKEKTGLNLSQILDLDFGIHFEPIETFTSKFYDNLQEHLRKMEQRFPSSSRNSELEIVVADLVELRRRKNLQTCGYEVYEKLGPFNERTSLNQRGDNRDYIY